MSNQQRGHCQCCGRQQAVLKSGYMSNHGYKVEWQQFIGTCPGNRFKPLEQDRSQLDKVCADIDSQCEELAEFATALTLGAYTPDDVRTRYLGKGVYETTPWADATEYQREAEIKRLHRDADHKMRQGAQIAIELRQLADRVHGTALITVKKQPPARIQLGERRIVTTARGDFTVEVTDVQGQRVFLRYLDHPNMKTTWIGNTAFRKLERAS